MDPDLGRFQTVWAAAGTPTAVFPVPPGTLRILANATVAPITEERRAADIEAERGRTDARVAAESAGSSVERRGSRLDDGATASNAGA